MRRFVLSSFVLVSLIGCGNQKAIKANAVAAASAEQTNIGREVARADGEVTQPDDLPSETPSSESSSLVKSRYYQLNHGTTMVGFFQCPGYGGTVFQVRSDFRIDSTYPNYWDTYRMAWFQINLTKSSTWYKYCYPFFSVQYVYF